MGGGVALLAARCLRGCFTAEAGWFEPWVNGMATAEQGGLAVRAAGMAGHLGWVSNRAPACNFSVAVPHAVDGSHLSVSSGWLVIIVIPHALLKPKPDFPRSAPQDRVWSRPLSRTRCFTAPED